MKINSPQVPCNISVMGQEKMESILYINSEESLVSQFVKILKLKAFNTQSESRFEDWLEILAQILFNL